jgi:UDP-GlcNAc3NAcA epimerase
MEIVTIVGARPQFIKAAPVSRAIERHNQQKAAPQINEILVHTGQHYDYNMSQIFFDELQIRKPEYHLGVGSGSHGQMTGTMLERAEKVLLEKQPDLVMVYGDTNSTLAGALSAAKLNIPVAHVEAGLRSFNRRMPEEINRVITDRVSTWLFCPTETAVVNLKNEGITQGVHIVGDVMYDSFLFTIEVANKRSVILSELGLKPGAYCLATVHREENREDVSKLCNLFDAFKELSNPDCPFVVPLHPGTLQLIQPYISENRLSPNVRIVPPVSYMDMIHLIAHARVILTDSGGIQKEAYFAKIPCITLRNETEWVETIEAGWNRLVGSEREAIISGFLILAGGKPESNERLFGAGNASQMIVEILSHVAA